MMLEPAIDPVGQQLEKLVLEETPAKNLVPCAVKHVQQAFGGALQAFKHTYTATCVCLQARLASYLLEAGL